jgi:hypothetical protein
VHGAVALARADLEGDSGGCQLRQLNPLRLAAGLGFIQDQPDIDAGSVLLYKDVGERGAG